MSQTNGSCCVAQYKTQSWQFLSCDIIDGFACGWVGLAVEYQIRNQEVASLILAFHCRPAMPLISVLGKLLFKSNLLWLVLLLL